MYTTIEREFDYEGGARLREIDKISGETREKMIIEFCSEGRTLKEIARLLGCKWAVTVHRHYLTPLIERGLLRKIDASEKLGSTTLYIDVNAEVVIPNGDEIIEYCSVPRSRHQIIKQVGLSDHAFTKIIKILISSGRLKRSDSSLRYNTLRYVAKGVEFIEEVKVPRMNATVQSVYNVIKENPYIKGYELSARLGRYSSVISRATDTLKKLGYIERVGSNVQGYWRVLK